MPRYEVISGEIRGRNGHTPKKKLVKARTPLAAAWRAHIIGRGSITKLSLVLEDDENKQYVYQATTSTYDSFTVHVQELWWLEYWAKLFGA